MSKRRIRDDNDTSETLVVAKRPCIKAKEEDANAENANVAEAAKSEEDAKDKVKEADQVAQVAGEDVLCFYASSAHRVAGKGPNECVSDVRDYVKLNEIPNWRRMFSSLYSGESLVWRGQTYRSHSHAFQAAKFHAAGHEQVATTFTVESGSMLGKYGNGLDAHKARKVVHLSAVELARWRSVEPQCKDEIYAAKYATVGCKTALLATKHAQLWNRGPRIRTLRNTRLERIRALLAATSC